MSTEEPWSWLKEIEDEAPNNDYGLPESYRMEFSVQDWAKIKSAITLMRSALEKVAEYHFPEGVTDASCMMCEMNGDNPKFDGKHTKDCVIVLAKNSLDKLSKGEFE